MRHLFPPLNIFWTITDVSNSYDLPEDVFQPGEVRPSRPKKKVVKKSEPTVQKRNIHALDVSSYLRNKITNQPAALVSLYVDIWFFGLNGLEIGFAANTNFTQNEAPSENPAKRHASPNGMPSAAATA